MPELFGKNWTKEELIARVGRMEQLAGIVAAEASDGPGRGSRFFHIYTGSGLAFDVMADRTLDLAGCRFKGMPIAWSSPSGWMHPGFYEAEGLGWLRSFQGGLCTTCGLDQYGAPSEDAGEKFGIHGRISNIPAEQVGYRAWWDGDEYRLEIWGEVRQARLFGENLVLQRRISTALGSNSIVMEDVVVNAGFSEQPHMIMYHCNFGFPLLSESTRLRVEVDDTFPRDADAEAGRDQWTEFHAPTPGYREQVFRHAPKADADGVASAVIENSDLGLSVRLSWNRDNLPHLVQWKQMGQGAYVLGVEPVNSRAMRGRGEARALDDLLQLAPGESRSYRLQFDILSA
ncbi:MAG: aldose 1-epimerase family protein [Caldilineales bacterium]|nr:aldose 1-epimerase family protein [Caldilineales bacterium]